MSTLKTTNPCPQCGYGGALWWYTPRTGEHTIHCRACGHDSGRLFIDNLLREPDVDRLELGPVEPAGEDGRSLVPFVRPGYGLVSVLFTTGGGFFHAFRSPPSDEKVARFRRRIEGDPTIAAAVCYITRWNGHTLEVLYGTLPPTQDLHMLAMAGGARDRRRER